ncbi:MAG: rnhB [Candidatus Taylorbacteria bacterium]|nr:rnhB [Candidatus Taylorbacteria bacterium]
MKNIRHNARYLVGIDEVGRGPIAGPVAVGAFIFLVDSNSLDGKAALRRHFRGVKESKQLSEAKREEWFAKILEAQRLGLVDFAVTFMSEKVIDSKGLSFAIRTALEKSLRIVVSEASSVPEECTVLLDGGLKAPTDFIHQETIIKGDAKEAVIALASICAKVLRDRRMRLHAKKHPNYGFDIHKGYGTKAHYVAIRSHGMLPLHRKSFLN